MRFLKKIAIASATAVLSLSGVVAAMNMDQYPVYADQTSDFVIEDGVLTKYNGQGGDVVIPDGVTSIGEGAFDSCSSLTSITIPDSVTSIGNWAFMDCDNLTEIDIPSSVTRIGCGAFDRCISLTSISIPSGVTSIEYYAFDGCKSLTSISIPSSVMNIEDHAFENCSSIAGITIPDSVKYIGEKAFFGCDNLKDIYYTGSKKNWNSINIASDAIGDITIHFSNIDFVIKDGVLTAYNGQGGDVVIPDGVTSIGVDVFFCCSSLTSISIPSSVTSIESGAFSGCSSITNISIPDGVTSIGMGAFSYCNSLKSVNIPSSVTSIGDGALSYCSSLEEITVASDNKVYDSRNNCNAIIETGTNTLIVGFVNTVIPSSVTSIGAGAFSYCNNLERIAIPSSVTNIGGFAFGGCDRLSDIYYAGSKDSWNGIPDVDYIGIPYTATIHYDHVHTNGKTEVTTAATYDKEGTGTHTCTVCGTSEMVTIPILTLSKPVVSAANISSGVKLSWAKITGAAGYYVYRDGTIVKKLTSGSTVTYTDTSAANGKSYVYTVKAYVGTNKSQLSAEKSIYRVTGTVLTTEVVNDGIKLSWTKNSSATGYKLYKSIDGGEYKFLKNITDNSTLSYKDTAVAAGKKYQYKMVAYITKSDKTYLSAYCGIKTSYYVPATYISEISNQISGIKLTWAAANDCDGYVVYRSDNGSEFKAIKTFTSPSTLTYTNTTVENGVKYQYKIRAYKTIDSAKRYSAYSSVKTDYFVASAAITSISNQASGIKLAWSENKNCDGYVVYRSDNGSEFKAIKTFTSASTLTYTNTTAENGVKYQYKIRAYKTIDGVKRYSAYSGARTICRVDAVTAASVTAQAGKAGLKWTANAKATGYKIYKSTNGSDYTFFKKITSNKTVTLTDTVVKKGDVCKYKIVAYITESGTDYLSSAVVKNVTVK